MARNYKRDSRGRFARANSMSSLKRAIKGRLVRRKSFHDKMIEKGYEVSKQYTYMADSRGRARKDGTIQRTRTEYRRIKK